MEIENQNLENQKPADVQTSALSDLLGSQKTCRIEVDWVGMIMQEIENKPFKRKQVAHTYRIIMEKIPSADWKTINEAIIKRWSHSGLEYIKNLAWSGKFLSP